MRGVLEGTWGPRRRSGGKERRVRESRRARPADRMGRQAARGMKARRGSSPPAEYADYIAHPRFGRKPRVTGLDVTDTRDGKVCCHWHSPPGVRVPNTALVADVTRQRPATVAVTHYFDTKRVCRKCKRPFLFFAEEQKYWYEALAFPLEADCLECPPCRKGEQKLRVVREKYDALLLLTARKKADTLELVTCALDLVESSVFSVKLLPKLRGLLKPLLVDAEGPSYTRARTVLDRLDRIAGLRAGRRDPRQQP